MIPSNEKNSLFNEKSSNKVARIAYRRIFGHTYTESSEEETLFYREIFRSKHIICSSARHTITLPKF